MFFLLSRGYSTVFSRPLIGIEFCYFMSPEKCLVITVLVKVLLSKYNWLHLSILLFPGFFLLLFQFFPLFSFLSLSKI